MKIKLFNFHCLALRSTKYNEIGMYQTEYVTLVPSKLMVMCNYLYLHVVVIYSS